MTDARWKHEAAMRAALDANDALRAEVADLKRRMRLARAAIRRSPLTAWRDGRALLDLSRQLPKRKRR